MPLEIRDVSGYEALERWTATRNEAGPDALPSEHQALLRAIELEHVNLLAEDAGEPVGTAFLSGDPTSAARGSAAFEIKVPERPRGRGIEAALLDAVAERARRGGHRRLHCTARSDDAAWLAFFADHGFEVIRRLDQLSLELGSTPRARFGAPPGIELCWLEERPDSVGEMFAVARATAAEDHDPRGALLRSEAQWRTYELGSPLARFDLTAVAFSESGVAGYSVVEDLPRYDVLFHRSVVVGTAWRARGVPEALLGAQADAARATGIEALVAVPRDERLAALYARLGYLPRKSWVELEAPIT